MTPTQVATVLAYLNEACALVTEATRALDDSLHKQAATKATRS
jgi:hypothetical protein